MSGTHCICNVSTKEEIPSEQDGDAQALKEHMTVQE